MRSLPYPASEPPPGASHVRAKVELPAGNQRVRCAGLGAVELGHARFVRLIACGSAVTDPGPALRLLSLGAGVQSTTVLLLACEGAIPRFDAALFADTGWEPGAVYAHLRRLRSRAAEAGIPVLTISAGNIRTDALDPKHRFVSMPLHTLNPDGSRGLARRQCTRPTAPTGSHGNRRSGALRRTQGGQG
jgi:hypothetical protein